MSPPPALELRDVTLARGKGFRLDVANLGFAAGEFATVLGASGSGKTTLLRLLGGMETPDRGSIHIGGADVTRVPQERRPVNMVFQSYALFPHLDVLGNIGFGPRATRMPRDEMEARCQEALSLVGLEGLERRKPEQLSGGQQQRVALARALVMRPQALLLDEPLAALDTNLREQVRDHLVRLQADTGITFVLVTHDHAEALAVSHRIVLLDQGKVIQVGSPREMYQRPANLVAARALGRLTTTPAQTNGSNVLHCPVLGDIPSPATIKAGVVTVALRPDKLRLQPGPAPDGRQATLTVERCEFQGSVSMVSLRAPDGSRLVAQSRDADAATGDQCHAGFDLRDLLLYDADGALAN